MIYTSYIITVFLILSVMIFPVSAYREDDTEPPVLSGIEIDRAFVAPGGSLIVSADAYDDDSGIKSIDVFVIHEKSETSYVVSLRRNEDWGAEDQYSGALLIPRDAETGEYVVRHVRLTDWDGNTASYRRNNRDDSFTIEDMRFTVSKAVPGMEVTGCRVESTPRGPRIILQADGLNGGLNRAGLTFQDTKNGRLLFVTLTYEHEYTDGSFQIEPDISSYASPGEFSLVRLTLRDKAGSLAVYDISPDSSRGELALELDVSFLY